MADPRTKPYVFSANGMALTGACLLYGVTWSHIANNAGASLGLYDVNTAHATSLKVTARRLVLFSGVPTGSVHVNLEVPTQFTSGIYASMTARSFGTLYVQRKQ